MEAGKTQQLDSKIPPPNSGTLNSVSWRRSLLPRAAVATLGGLVLRLWMFKAFPQGQGDALIYGTLARNIVLHGQFALTDGSGVIHPTLIRLPGYPLFLAACFRLFGLENYSAVAWLQIVFELAACLLLADSVRRIASPRAGLNTLWLAALCPFTAVYSSAPLSESLTFDFICLALWSLHIYRTPFCATSAYSPLPQIESRSILSAWHKGRERIPGRATSLALFTVAISSAAMLRPDGALLAIALWPALLLPAATPAVPDISLRLALLRRGFLCALISILPFAAWSIRNWQVFHVFQPLAPRYANDPGEDPHLGWQHWVKTWCLDFTCTSEIYWNVPDSPIDVADLPARAFDSPEQRQLTESLIAAYNTNNEITPDLDARFEALAQARAASNPLRSYILMPLGRLADMSLRPRVENLTIDLRWWEYWNHRPETRFSWSYAALNLILLGLGIAGFFYRPPLWQYMAAYLVLRSVLLLTIEAPETRYTLEFFPMLFALGGITLQRIFIRNKRWTQPSKGWCPAACVWFHRMSQDRNKKRQV